MTVTANRRAIARRWRKRPESVRPARDELCRLLADWGLVALEYEASLVLSELLTNAIVHAQMSPDQAIKTRFAPQPNGVLIQVDDPDDRRPELCSGASEGGRGLALVAELSESWGVTDRYRLGWARRERAGKSVWAVLTLPGKGWT